MKKAMEKALSVLLAAGILSSVCAASIGFVAANGTENPATGIALKYTGAMDDLGFPTDWSGDDVHELKKVGTGTSDTTGSFQIKWDENAVYVKAVIADATQDGGNDQFKVLLDVDGKPAGDAAVNFGGANAVNAGVYAWNAAPYYIGNADPINAYDGGATGMGTNFLNTPGIQMSYADGNYTILAALKFNDDLKSKLANNSEIGFDIRWNDFNGATSAVDEKMTTIGWASSQAKWNDDLREIGSITLLNERPAPPAPAEPAKGTAIYGTPEMDGKLSEWSDVPANEFKNVTENKEITGSFKLMWDEEAIYVAVQVTDKDEDSSLIKVLFNLDGVPVGDERIMMSDATPFAAVYSVNWEGFGFGFVPNNAGFSYYEGAKGWDQFYAGKNILSGAMNVFATYPTTYELKYTFNEETKAKLVEGAKIGFDIMYLDYFGGQNTSDLGWATPNGKETFGLDLRNVGEVTLAPAPSVEPLEPTEGAPEAVTPGKEDVTSTTIDLKWTTAEDAAGYDVLVFTVSGSGDNREYTFLKKESVAGSTLTLINLDPGTEYAFQILAADETGERVAVYKMIYATTLLSDDEQSGEDSEDSEGSDGSEDSDASVDDSKPGNSDSENTPDTGHSDVLFVILALLVISTATVCLLRRRKEN